MTNARQAGAVLAAAWLVAVAVIAAVKGPDTVANLACAPAALWAGKLWTLPSSALIIQGPAIPQLLMTAALAAALVRACGGAVFWLVAAVGHVGATLIAYAGIGLIYLVARSTAEGVVHVHDYGISAVWAAAFGALAVIRMRRGDHPRLTATWALAILVLFVVLVPINGELADVEHLLAFVLGAGVMLLRGRSGHVTTLAA
ncbi:MAG TPA: hypothetical protein VFL73_06370 [Solirubrobacteraceae bacterium]|nr:hypothetical protein [Solirubrobacteraceae bacterium]